MIPFVMHECEVVEQNYKINESGRSPGCDLAPGRRDRAVKFDHSISCISRRGECWNIAAVERFSATLKIKTVFRSKYTTRGEARANIFDYIERFYNPRRRHWTLNGLSPVKFENAKWS